MVQLRAFVEDNHRSEVKEVAILIVDPMQVKNQMRKCKVQQLYPNYKENAGRWLQELEVWLAKNIANKLHKKDSIFVW